MLKLHKELQRTSENTDKWHELKREIEKMDKMIDERVFELYGVMEEERMVIER